MNVTAMHQVGLTLPVKILAFATVYALISLLGLALLDVPMELVEIWPAAGLATAVLLSGDQRIWPGIPLGFLAAYWVETMVGLDPTLPQPMLAPPLVGAAAATLQAALAVMLIGRRFGDPARLTSARDWLELGLYAGPLSCAGGAVLGGLGLYATHDESIGTLFQAMLNWWLGDVTGVLLILPVALTWPMPSGRHLRWQGKRLPALSRLAAVTGAVGLVTTLSLAHLINTTDTAKDRKLFLGAVDRGGAHLLYEYVSLRAILNAAALDVSHMPENPMYGLSQMRSPEPVYQLGGMDGFGLIRRAEAPAQKLKVSYFEPMAGREELRGRQLELNGEAELAATKAYESGKPTVATVTLSAPGKRPIRLALLLQPAFHHNLPRDTPQARRDALIGWVFLLIAPDKLFGQDVEKEAGGAQLASVGYNVPDGTPHGYRTVFANPAIGHEPLFQKAEIVEAFQRDWRFTWHSTAWFEAAMADRTAVLVLYGGLLLTALSIGLVQALFDRDKRVREAEQRWRLALEGSEIVVFDVDLVNQEEITSDPRQQMSGTPAPRGCKPELQWSMSIHPDDLDGLHRAEADLSAGRTDRLLHEYRLRTADGSWRWVRSSARIIDRDEDGKPLRLLGTMSDVTPLKEALDLAEERQRELASLIETAPVAMAVLTSDGALQTVNDAFCAFVGYPRDVLIGARASELPNVRDLRICDELLPGLLEGEAKSAVLEKRYLRPNGEDAYGIVTASTLRSRAGEEKKCIVQIVDITERKRLERLKGDFVATVSHELRTPLTSISGSIALVLGTMADQMPDKAKHMLDIAQNNAKRLGSLVNDLLDMQKLASGNMKLETVQADVGAVMQEAVCENDAYAKRFGVSYALHLPPEPVSAEIDINRFKQVMANLMSNAAKFSPEGGQIEITLEPEEERGRQFARVSVTDNGRGIPPEFHERIFRPFSQAAASSTRDREGTGLGLVISKEIVEKMGGTIGFDSEPDVRTTFWFRFPIAIRNDATSQAV